MALNKLVGSYPVVTKNQSFRGAKTIGYENFISAFNLHYFKDQTNSKNDMIVKNVKNEPSSLNFGLLLEFLALIQKALHLRYLSNAWGSFDLTMFHFSEV
ncbi:hypothetical protein TNCT_487591 [Trichonephila clavata]|uniref:Uncharacterized protein n=1 Tax=Trichonephila clavata TaxID=2740835 RepID=A0A8X6IJL6_TRICU|nr:hypothetical protein TNCT_487591 [Trichonephila clavata]